MILIPINRRVVGLLAVLFLGVAAPAQSAPATNALVLYDTGGQYGWMGEIYSLHLENLLGHFEIPVARKPLAEYQPGDVEDYDATFYVGALYNDTGLLPAGFLDDIDSTSKTVVWMGFNLWLYAWNLVDYDFEGKYGLSCLVSRNI